MIVEEQSEKSVSDNLLQENQDIEIEENDLLQEKLAYLQSLDQELADIKNLQKDLDSEMDGICEDPTYEKWAYLTKDDILSSAL